MKVNEKSVREARLKKEFSQEYVASLLGMSQPKYSRLEKGEVSFTIEELNKLIELLDVNLLEIIDFSEKEQVFIHSSYSGNINSTIKNIDKKTLRKIIREEIKKMQ